MPGTKDIAVILRQMDDEKYQSIIERAELNGYHDFKFDNIPGHAEYGNCVCPKIQLVNDLTLYPELNFIRKDVVDGKYDEMQDEQDQEEMRGWLIDDNAPDEIFDSLGLDIPTKEEKELRIKQKENN